MSKSRRVGLVTTMLVVAACGVLGGRSIRAQQNPVPPSFSYTFQGRSIGEPKKAPVGANDVKVDFRNGGENCFIQFTDEAHKNVGDPVPCPANADSIDITWGISRIGGTPGLLSCKWLKKQDEESATACKMPDGHLEDFHLVATNGIENVFWTKDGKIFPERDKGVPPPKGVKANDVDFSL
jgi:hypothetical protein